MNEAPPPKLGAKGLALWRQVVDVYDLRPDELSTLESACREASLVARLDEELSAADLVVTGSMGQQVVNPLVSEIRQHRSTLNALLKSLKLPDDVASGGERSAAARDAVNARWKAG